MSKSNFIVRGGGDFSGIQRELQKTQKQINTFQGNINKSMSGIGKAFKIGLGYISVRAIAGFVKTTTGLASDMTEVQNVVDTVFGSMAEDINDFSKISIEQFGLSELSAKKYSSTMGAMLKSSGIAGKAVRDMSIDLTKLSADMASFYNLDNEVAFRKIMSGMSGMTMPLKELGINMNIANLENYAMAQGIRKSWQEMTQAEQTMVRYNYLLSVTGDAQGDFAKNSHTWANQTKILSQQFEILKGTIGAGFINMLMPVVRGLNTLIKHIQVAAEYFKAFTRLIFGDAEAGSQGGVAVETMADNLGDVEDGFGDVGKAGKKAGKDLKGAIAGFDEINSLADKASGGAGGLADELGGIGGVGPIDLGTASSGELDLDTSKIESKFNNIKNVLADIYTNWGMKDFFKGFRDGLDLISFENIKTNFQTTFNGLGEIASIFLLNLQPIFQSAGQTLGTLFKYGIAIVGNLFEPISLGWANFTTNMKGSIQSWITSTSKTITNGYKNLNSVFEGIGQSWLNSINKYKPLIAKATEDTLTNVSKTFMLIGTVTTETFEAITRKVKDFVNRNKKDIKNFMDSILGIFTDIWGLINNVWSSTLTTLKEFWDEWGLSFVEGVMDIVNQIGEWFLYLWNDLVKPIWDTMLEWLKKIWDDSLKDILGELLGFVGRVGEIILELWENILRPLLDNLIHVLVPIFREVFTLALDIVGSVVDGIGTIIKGLLKILNGLIDFIVGVFTDDWKRAWRGVRDIFKGIFDTLYGFVKAPLNMIISAINTVIRGLNSLSITIPDWVPGVGGKTWGINILQIPKLAKGGITNGPTMALIGDNPGGREVVSPLDDLVDMIQTAVNNAVATNNSASDTNATIVLKIGETELGRTTIKAINKYQRQVGETLLEV